MRIGFVLPQYGRGTAQIDQVASFATRAEEHGAESLWVETVARILDAARDGSRTVGARS